MYSCYIDLLGLICCLLLHMLVQVLHIHVRVFSFSVSYFYHLTVIRNVNAVRETNHNKDRIMTCDTQVRDGEEREGAMRRYAGQETQNKRTSGITPIGELDGCYALSGNPPRM